MTELRDLLRDMASHALTYDVTDRAMRVSRHRRVLVRAAVPASLAVVVAVLAVAVNRVPQAGPHIPGASTSPTPAMAKVIGPVACELTRLALPPGDWKESYARVASPDGRFITGAVSPETGGFKLVIWDNGIPHQLPIAGHDQDLAEIDNDGDAIGNYFPTPSAEERESFYWHDGKVTMLKGRDPVASAFNSAGVIVGSVEGRPAIWRDPLKEPQFLAVPDEMWTGTSVDIDDAGNIVGTFGPRGAFPFEQRIALWSPSGEFRWFPRPEQLGAAWKVWPIGFSQGKVAFRATNEDNYESRWGRWDPMTNEYSMTAYLHGASEPIATDNGWQLVHRGARSFIANASSEVELTKPADATGDSSTTFRMTRDDRTVTASLNLSEQWQSAAVVWRCR